MRLKLPASHIVCCTFLYFILCISCSPSKLIVSDISYQSIKNKRTDLKDRIPSEAKILVTHKIGPDGSLRVLVKNLSNEIMSIDRTKSFFINTDGISTPFYNPNITSSSTTNISTNTNSIGVNPGSLSSALGAPSSVSNILGSMYIGGSTTTGQSTSNTLYAIDSPKVSIAPNGEMDMACMFNINAVGKEFLRNLSKYLPSKNYFELATNDYEKATSKFSVTISYSIDNEATYERITSDYYVDCTMMDFVKEHGKTNEPLRNIYVKKPDALSQPWFIIFFNSNKYMTNDIYRGVNLLYDYQ